MNSLLRLFSVYRIVFYTVAYSFIYALQLLKRIVFCVAYIKLYAENLYKTVWRICVYTYCLKTMYTHIRCTPKCVYVYERYGVTFDGN